MQRQITLMKKSLLLLSLLCAGSLTSSAQMQLNLPLLSSWSNPSIPPATYGAYNDCWGYVDANGREYAIAGSSKGTHFIDITNPAAPVEISFQPTKDPNTLSIHRDFKTYQHYAYGVTDQGDNSLQIFDLQYLPDSVVKVYDSNVLTKRCHNIHIEGDKLYLASNTVGNGFNAMDVVSLANPTQPVLLSSLNSPNFSHVHDVFVRNDTAYCSVGYDGLYVYYYGNPTTPQFLMSLTSYPEQGYNHSSWMKPGTMDLVMADETHGSGLKIIDLSDFGNPVVKSIFRSNLLNVPAPTSQNGSIVHNPFVKGNYAFLAYYHDGVQVFDISDPTAPTSYAYYDTHPQSTDYSSYKGCWGVYPFLPSGNIIASDMNNGLFIFDGSALTGIENPEVKNSALNIYPNPFRDQITLTVPAETNHSLDVVIRDITGRMVYSGNFVADNKNSVTISTEDLSAGAYSVTASWNGGQTARKIIKW
jgi:choice-of-anchor B domain-containing protein